MITIDATHLYDKYHMLLFRLLAQEQVVIRGPRHPACCTPTLENVGCSPDEPLMSPLDNHGIMLGDRRLWACLVRLVKVLEYIHWVLVCPVFYVQ